MHLNIQKVTKVANIASHRDISMPQLQAYRNKLDFATPADQLESIFTNLDILQKSGSSVKIDSGDLSQHA